MFQESGEASSDSTQRLIGHWRKTTIVFESPKDEHVVLHADGTAENWVVTADSRSEPVTGRWSVEGKTLTLSVRGKPELETVHLLRGPTRFSKYSETPWFLGKD